MTYRGDLSRIRTQARYRFLKNDRYLAQRFELRLFGSYVESEVFQAAYQDLKSQYQSAFWLTESSIRYQCLPPLFDHFKTKSGFFGRFVEIEKEYPQDNRSSFLVLRN